MDMAGKRAAVKGRARRRAVRAIVEYAAQWTAALIMLALSLLAFSSSLAEPARMLMGTIALASFLL